MLPDRHTDFSRGQSGGLVFPFLSEFSTVYCDPHSQRLWHRQSLTNIKGEIDNNTIIVGDFNTPLTPMDRSSKHKINKETKVLYDTLDEMDLTDIFRTFHINAEEYTFFSSAYGTISRIDYILDHKSNLSKFKKIKIVSLL